MSVCGKPTPRGGPCAREPHDTGIHLSEAAIRRARDAFDARRAELTAKVAVPAPRRPPEPVKAKAVTR